jgi:hypothetical protein
MWAIVVVLLLDVRVSHVNTTIAQRYDTVVTLVGSGMALFEAHRLLVRRQVMPWRPPQQQSGLLAILVFWAFLTSIHGGVKLVS